MNNNNKNKLRILHLRASNFYGGPERQLHFHAKYAKDKNTDVIISSFLENSQTPEFITIISNDNIETHTFDVANAYDRSAVKKIQTYLLENNIDILCTHDYRTHFYGMFATKNIKTKWIAFSRGMTKENLKIKIFTFFEKYIIKKADYLVAVSESQKQKLIAQSVQKNRITTIHNAIDISLVDNIKPLSLKERFDFPHDSIVAISGGRFSEEKGQIDFVKAAEIAMRKNKYFRFVLFGDGPDVEKIKKYIHEKNLGRYIICPGFEKNILSYLKDADMLVNPSLSEGLPNIVLEAMASQIPVIATNVGGLPEIINSDYNGILVPSQNSLALADALLVLASDVQVRDTYKKNARQTIIDSFNFKSQNNKLINLYTQIAD